MEEPENYTFSYEVFDRQLNNFYRMLSILIEGWEDYSPQELTFDVRSLLTKATRLCHMAEQDMVMQHSDLAKQRKEANEEHASKLGIIVGCQFTSLMAGVVKDVRAGHLIEGNRTKWAPIEMTKLFPQLNAFLETDEISDGTEISIKDVEEIEHALFKKLKPTKMAGVKPVEKLWNLFQLYCMSCYLLLHFRRIAHFTTLEMSEEQTARLMEMSVQQYPEEKENAEEIERYFAMLKYINNVERLSEKQLLEARKELIKEVPRNLQLAFIKNVSDIRRLGAQLVHIDFTPQDFQQLLTATVKWHLIEQELYALYHPEHLEPSLYNTVFYNVVNGVPTDMLALKERIAKMVDLVTRKNHWFCVWCVLKHNNYLKETQNFEAFATQMMNPDWFGNEIDERYTFSGDTLREYRRYFSDLDYQEWDNDIFLEQREMFNMTKWSTNLCNQFSNLCYKMEERFTS